MIDPYWRQEQIPEKNDQLIKSVVRGNFDLIVNDKKKDVILLFFQPGCHNCEEFTPKYEIAAQRMSNNKNIVFAKINAAHNELEDYDIKRFPDVKFYPANDKNPIDVILQKTSSGIIEFIKTITTFPWVEPLPEITPEEDL